MRPDGLKTKIFLDSGNPLETRQVKALAGFLDGQKMSFAGFARNPEIRKRRLSGSKFSALSLKAHYIEVAQEIWSLLDGGKMFLSIMSDPVISADEMKTQAVELWEKLPGVVINFPATAPGLEAAVHFLGQGKEVGVEWIFTQNQAAACAAAHKIAPSGSIWLFPHITGLDNAGINGMDLVGNLVRNFKKTPFSSFITGDGISSIDHLMFCMFMLVPNVCAPLEVIQAWSHREFAMPKADFSYPVEKFRPLPFEQIDLEFKQENYDLDSVLTRQMLESAAQDWQSLIE